MNLIELTKQHLIIALLGTGIIISSILVTPDAYARHLSDNQRYSDGFNDGTQAARTDRQNRNSFNPACDPTGAHTSDGQHTTIYCTGWSNGYTSAWNRNNSQIEQSSTQNQRQDQRQNQAVHTCIALKCEIIQGGSQGQDQQSNQGISGDGQ
ncbi:hypothetical protein [Nitrososphaera sp. AFS]|uniref:hypothetical protein n=1 Tax=Nitrososphaera sp. AFS TaxID=2301191 RepID=UPI0013921F5E|nr:hypothetical protein [Nitrososphaera sp. AFS]NAL78186.1 hypothetical protein [Nitrososphaera sp. AFS]